MDVDGEETPSRNYISERVKRWSMNSTRVEQIVKELMQPISDLRRNFDTDLSALLEEYLTEAGLHALEAEEGGHGEGGGGECNFAEVALLLQQSANIYGKKVDYLYQHVIDISDHLHPNTQDESGVEGGDGGDGAETSSPSRRRKGAGGAVWGALELGAGGVEDRGAGGVVPPVLPRPRLDLLPRDLLPHDRPLTDTQGDHIGLLHDYLTTRPTRDGLLVEVLELSGPPRAPLRATSLPPPLCRSSPLLPELPPPPPPPDDVTAPATDALVVEKQARKRNSLAVTEDITLTTLNFKLSKSMRMRLSRNQSEFDLPAQWTQAVTSRHARRIRALRGTLQEDPILYRDPVNIDSLDFNVGFRGWSRECILASSVYSAASLPPPEPPAPPATPHPPGESDDDGFFEMSGAGGAEGVLGGEEVRGWCDAVLGALGGGGHLAGVIHTLATRGQDVSRVLLATLLLANAGNVSIEPPSGAGPPYRPPLRPSQVRLRVLSADPARYCAAAHDHPPPPAHTHNRKVTHDSDFSERSDSASTESDPRGSGDLHDSGYLRTSCDLRDSDDLRDSGDLQDSGYQQSSGDLRDSDPQSSSNVRSKGRKRKLQATYPERSKHRHSQL